MEELRQKLDKEYEQCVQTNAKDLDKLVQKHQAEVDRKVWGQRAIRVRHTRIIVTSNNKGINEGMGTTGNKGQAY